MSHPSRFCERFPVSAGTNSSTQLKPSQQGTTPVPQPSLPPSLPPLHTHKLPRLETALAQSPPPLSHLCSCEVPVEVLLCLEVPHLTLQHAAATVGQHGRRKALTTQLTPGVTHTHTVTQTGVTQKGERVRGRAQKTVKGSCLCFDLCLHFLLALFRSHPHLPFRPPPLPSQKQMPSPHPLT